MDSRRRRQRREYLKQKEQEEIDKKLESRKKIIEDALENNKKLPYELKQSGATILNEIIYNGNVDEDHRYPKIMVTTSRNPSSTLLYFSKYLGLIFNAEHIMRGNMVEKDISLYAEKHDYTCVIIVHENRGRPVSLFISCFPYGPTIKFTIIEHFCAKRMMAHPEKCYFICDNMEGTVGEKIKERMCYLFPKCDNAKRIVSFVNKNETIAFRHYFIEKGEKISLIKNFGMDLRLFEVTRGTFEMEGDVDWVFRPYMNSCKPVIAKCAEDENNEE